MKIFKHTYGPIEAHFVAPPGRIKNRSVTWKSLHELEKNGKLESNQQLEKL